MAEMLTGYLSKAARRPAPVRAAFADGLEGMIESFAPLLDGANARERAVVLLARIVGAPIMPSRGVPEEHPLANEILLAVFATCLDDLA